MLSKTFALNRFLEPDDTAKDGEKIVGDTLCARQKVARKKIAGQGKGTIEEKERKSRGQNVRRDEPRRGTAQSLSPDNRQLEERGGCRGG